MKLNLSTAQQSAARLGQKDFTPSEAPERRDHLADKFNNERAGTVPCPMISILLMEDRLVPDADGQVSVKELKKALEGVGIGTVPKHGLGTLSAFALEGSPFADKVNIFDLFGSSIDHKGSLGALQDGGWNQAFHDQVKACSKDGKTLTLEDLGTAQLIRLEQDDGGFKDKMIGRAEIAALMLVFGTPNAEGVKSISLEDWDTIFKNNRLPDSWQKHTVNMTPLLWGMTKMAFKQNTTAAGRAEKGLRDGLEMPQTLGADMALLGLGAMCPAGMRPKGGVGVSEQEINALHQAMIPADARQASEASAQQS